jgi:hypothetical protein
MEGAKRKWLTDFADKSVPRTRAKKLNALGQWSGEMVWLLEVKMPPKQRTVNFKDGHCHNILIGLYL